MNTKYLIQSLNKISFKVNAEQLSNDEEYTKQRNIGLNNNIQIIRAFLCVILILYHYTCRYSQLYHRPDFYSYGFNFAGEIALACFLFLSGFFFLNENYIENKDIKNFVKNKVQRLYGEYLYAITVIFIITRTGLLGPERTVSFSQYILNTVFLNVFLHSGFVDGSHWYIVFMLFMTIIMACLIVSRIVFSKIFWTLNGVFLVLLLGLDYIYGIKCISTIKHYIMFYLYFSMGLIIKSSINNINKHFHLLTSLILYISAIIMNKGVFFGLVVSIVFFSIFNCYINDSKYKVPILTDIGNNSYLIYLVHQNVGYCIINYLLLFNLQPKTCIAFALMLILLFSFILKKIYKEIYKYAFEHS